MKKLVVIIAVFFSQVIMAQQVKFFRTFGFGIYDSGEGVMQSNDTGYVVGGITTRTGSNGTDMLIYKTDSLGDLQWYKNIGLNNYIEGAKAIASGKNKSEYLLVGYQNKYDSTGYNFYLAKTDLNGDTLWTRTYGGNDWDMAYAVDTLQDSTYVIAGETYSFGAGNSDMLVMRMNSDGDTLWTRTFGGPQDDYARYVLTDRTQNILVVGTTYSFGAGGSDVYMVYLNPMGDTIWTSTHGTAVDEFGYSADMYIDNSDNMSFAYAYTQFNPVSSEQETRFFRGNSVNGGLIYDVYFWFENDAEIFDHPRMRKDGKGKFYMVGDIRYSPDGPTNIFLHRTNYGIDFNLSSTIYVLESEYPHDVRKCFDNGMIVTGSTTSYGPGPMSTFLLKTDSMLVAPFVPVVSVDENTLLDFTAYPNPVTGNLLYVTSGAEMERLFLYDMNGRMVSSWTGNNYTAVSLYLNEIPSGMYVLEVKGKESVGRKKIIVNH